MNATNTASASDLTPPLEARALHHSYDEKPVLTGVDLTLETGQVLGLIGRNGAGKSTLIRAALGLLEPQRGEAWIFGEPALRLGDRAKERIAYVPQQPEALAWLTARQMFDYLGRFYPRWDHDFSTTQLTR